ncbi:rRNA-processing protein EBP2 [Fusarium piperis]|uniref:rRNA-processing protein EBP2 n=1 Tax=Fusarium piperis TaxID=1435070 RepID=A0A9W9BT60_9HYPO|nr:rRNA-processing protein EBP2 [Fusarium piperis]
MVTKGKLKMALAAEKGTDFKKLKLKRKQKEAEKRNKAAGRGAEESDEEEEVEDEVAEVDDDEDEEEDEVQYNLEGIDDSDDSDSSIELEEKIPRKSKKNASPVAKKVVDEEEDEEEEDDEDIPMSDLEDLDDADKEDIIPHQRLTINNTTALLAALNRIAIPSDKSVPFATHQSVLAQSETSASIPDVQDDLQRELAFYSQSLDAARQARKLLRAEGVPFSRPKDYFAEMVKEDAHMEKVKAKLVEEASNKKAATEARKLRDLKKFGKQVQVAKLQERQKAKRETLEKIKTLKRKRQESGGADLGTNEADIFDVGVESEMKKHNQRSGAGRGQVGAGSGTVNHKRAKKNEKYGFGGKKRHAKSGDAVSSSDLSGFNAKKMKAGSKVSKPRPGKARRKAMGAR